MEYAYYDFGTRSLDLIDPGLGWGTAFGPDPSSIKQRVQTVTLGINYHFWTAGAVGRHKVLRLADIKIGSRMADGDKTPPKRNVRIDAGDYLIRTVTVDDASDRWGAWMADLEVTSMLNAPARSMSKEEVTKYINTFDQRSDLLWGIFYRRTGVHIGFFTVNADYARSQGIVNLLIGEAEYRNRGVLSVIRRYFAEYFFRDARTQNDDGNRVGPQSDHYQYSD